MKITTEQREQVETLALNKCRPPTAEAIVDAMDMATRALQEDAGAEVTVTMKLSIVYTGVQWDVEASATAARKTSIKTESYGGTYDPRQPDLPKVEGEGRDGQQIHRSEELKPKERRR